MTEGRRDRPPRVLAVIGHGRTESLGHRLLAAARDSLAARGVEVRVHDLLADGFDPVLRLPPGATAALPEHGVPAARRYQADVTWMDALLMVHPVWWFGPPAILKGWIDQVLVDTVAFRRPPTGLPQPLLGGRRALLVQTYNAPRTVDRFIMKGIAETFWRRAVFLSVGIRPVRRLAFHKVDGASEAYVRKMESKTACAALELVRRLP
jgi:NAD(P)H dehydrogenase (quinone)